MKILDVPKLKTELQTMFRYKWSCLNQWLVPGIIDDIVKFIEQYKNERN
jgi:hypothetical protein